MLNGFELVPNVFWEDNSNCFPSELVTESIFFKATWNIWSERHCKRSQIAKINSWKSVWWSFNQVGGQEISVTIKISWADYQRIGPLREIISKVIQIVADVVKLRNICRKSNIRCLSYHFCLSSRLRILDINSRIAAKTWSIRNEVTIRGISYLDCIANDLLGDAIRQETKSLKNIVTVKKCTLKWQRHISKAKSISPTIQQGTTLAIRRKNC